MTHFPLGTVLNVRKMAVEYPCTRDPDGIFHQIQHLRKFCFGRAFAAGAGIEVAEINAGQQAVIQRDQLEDLLSRADDALLPHGFQADGCRVSGLLDRVQDVAHVFLGVFKRFGARLLAHAAGVHDDAVSAQPGRGLAGGQHIADIFLHALLVPIGQVNVVGGVQRHGNAILRRLRGDFARGRFANIYASAALVFIGIEPHIVQPARSVGRGFKTRVGKRLCVARRAEFNLCVHRDFSFWRGG